jgi:hypothetical protein
MFSMEHELAGPQMIPVNYELVAGKHFFTAATGLGQGRCVAHRDLKTAHDEVGRQLKIIPSENHHLEVRDPVYAPAAFEEFRDHFERRLRQIGAHQGAVRVDCAGAWNGLTS